MDSLFSRLSNLILGEPEEETEDERLLRLRKLSKQQLLAKSQRAVILDDLEHVIQSLHHLLKSKPSAKNVTSGSASAPGSNEDTGDDESERTLSPNNQNAMMESTDEQKQLLLNDDLAVVNMLCTHLDRCMAHGLRPMESDPSSTVKFFGVLKWTCTRIEAIRQKQMVDAMHTASSAGSKKVCKVVTSSVEPDLPRYVRGFVGAVRAANSLTNVRTDEGKARAFARQALNMHVLRSSMSLILSETNMDLLASYYTEFALFRQRDDVKMFLSMLSGLDDLGFAFLIDDMRLDLAPDTLPFSKPLPRPKAQKIKKTAPKLIDPEDMVGGRVRLCEEDTETNLLVEKLVSHHELRSTFNTKKGGNPLSDILKQAASSQKMEDAATAVLRFLELSYPEYDVFGTELLDVLCNPFLSGMARFETAMAIPDVVEACFCYLYENVDTPGLFQVHLQADHVMELRDTIEELGGFHIKMSVNPHEVTAILLQYLWELPDALLTEERMENFLACGAKSENGMDEDEKKMLLRVLVNDLPWYCKPILERLCHLIMVALEPCHAEKNGLSLYSIANCLAPIILRRKHGVRFHEYEDPGFRKYPVGYQNSSSVRFRLIPDANDNCPFSDDTDRVAAESRALRHMKRDAEESAHVLSLLFREHDYILSDFRQELVHRRSKLREKVYFLETIRFKMEEPIDTTNAAHVALLKRLWDGLLPSTNEQEPVFDDAAIDVNVLLASERWKVSGFHTENPLGGFRGGGLLSLETLVFFVEEYPSKARSMMERNAIAGGNRYPFPVASINVMRMTMKLLMMDEAPDVYSKLVLHSTDENIPTTVLKMRIAERVSRTPFWNLLNDQLAFFKLHSMAFMLLDLHWIHSGATQMGFQPVLDATRRQMGWLLEQSPTTVEEMWTTWMEVREQHARKYTPTFADSTMISGITQESDDLVEQMIAHLKEKDEENQLMQQLNEEEDAVQLQKQKASFEGEETAFSNSAESLNEKDMEPATATDQDQVASLEDNQSLSSAPISNEVAQAY
ncbi:Pleckstrin y domain-containing family m member 2, partial [Globisporangium splendens]